MKTRYLCLLAILLSLAPWPVLAHEYKVGTITINHPWSRATPKGAPVAGGFMTLTNTGTAPDRLIGGSSPVAGRFEVHEMAMAGGVMRMRPLTKGLELKPGATVELKPGSFHIMFMDLKQPLAKGERIKGTLMFEKAGAVEIEYQVEEIGAAAAGHSGH